VSVGQTRGPLEEGNGDGARTFILAQVNSPNSSDIGLG